MVASKMNPELHKVSFGFICDMGLDEYLGMVQQNLTIL